MLLKWVILLFVIQAAVHVNCAPRKKEHHVEEPVKKHPHKVIIVKEEIEPKDNDEVVLKKCPIKIKEVVKVKEHIPKKKRIIEEKGGELKKAKTIKIEKVSECKKEEKKHVEKKKHSSKREEIKKEVVEVEKKRRPKKVEVKKIVVEKKHNNKEKVVIEKHKCPKKKEKIIIEKKVVPKKQVVVEKKKKVKVYKPDLEEFEDVKPYHHNLKPYKDLGAYKSAKPYEGKLEEFKGAEEYVGNLRYENKMMPYKGGIPYKQELVYDAKTLPYEGLKGYSGGIAYENKLPGYKGALAYHSGMHYEDKLEPYKEAKGYYSSIDAFQSKPFHSKTEKGEALVGWGKDKFEDFESRGKKPIWDLSYGGKQADIFNRGSLFKPEYGFGGKESISVSDLYGDCKEKEYATAARDWGSNYKSYDLYDKRGEALKYSGYDKHYGSDIGGKGLMQRNVGMHLGMGYNEKPLDLGPKYGDLGKVTDLRSKYSREIGPKFENKIGGEIISRGTELGHMYENTDFHYKGNLGNKYSHDLVPKYTAEVGNKYNNEVNTKYTEEIHSPHEVLTHDNIGKYVTYEKKMPKTIVIEAKQEKCPVTVKKHR